MDLDLAQVRAFVEAAEGLHFGRAATRLYLTQQALSKRIQRLEHTIGEPLFIRGPRGVQLTAAGQRLLPHARQLVAAADAAASAARPASWPLRLDVWGQVAAPLRMVAQLVEQTPELSIELSMRRSLTAALEAIDRGELDACFGRPHDLQASLPAGLAHRPAVLERHAVALSTEHPLAGAALLRPADLRGSSMWCAASGSPPELMGWWRRLAERLGVDLDTGGHNLGLEHAIQQLRATPTRFATFGVDWPIPADAGIRLVPLDPVPCLLWSLVWQQADRHPLLALLLERLAQPGHTKEWLAYDPEHDWLPDPDPADLRHSQAEREVRLRSRPHLVPQPSVVTKARKAVGRTWGPGGSLSA
jgi:DNA-binding transcriptional LysR family regulator